MLLSTFSDMVLKEPSLPFLCVFLPENCVKRLSIHSEFSSSANVALFFLLTLPAMLFKLLGGAKVFAVIVFKSPEKLLFFFSFLADVEFFLFSLELKVSLRKFFCEKSFEYFEGETIRRSFLGDAWADLALAISLSLLGTPNFSYWKLRFWIPLRLGAEFNSLDVI